MAFTTHGFQIPGTPEETPVPSSRVRCGGPGLCSKCSEEAGRHTDNYGPTAGFEGEIYPGDNTTNYQLVAMKLVRDYIDEKYRTEGPRELPAYETYVPWFSKTLTHWKAMVSTTIEDGMYYEVTHDGYKRCTYLDAYKKRENVVIPD